MVGVVTSISPKLLNVAGEETGRAIDNWPDGMTLSINDVVWFEMVGKTVWIIQRMEVTA